jgi:hypothetical protein
MQNGQVSEIVEIETHFFNTYSSGLMDKDDMKNLGFADLQDKKN